MIFAIERSIEKLGRIVLPKDMRDYFNINKGDEIKIIVTEEGILIKKIIEKTKEADQVNTSL